MQEKKELNIAILPDGSEIPKITWKAKYGRVCSRKINKYMLLPSGLDEIEVVKLKDLPRVAPKVKCLVNYDISYVYEVLSNDVFIPLGFQKWENAQAFLALAWDYYCNKMQAYKLMR